MKNLLKFLFVSLLFAPLFSLGQAAGTQPRDNFYNRVSPAERTVIPYDDIREKDVFWQKRIWRVISVDEKLNLPFKYFHKEEGGWQEIRPLIDILLTALKSGEITAYEKDNFKTTMTYGDAIKNGGAGYDTVPKYDKATGEVIGDTVVFNEFNLDNIKKYRLKEDWFFDEESSTMQCRIVGIAPLYHDEGLGVDRPLFWAYYPTLRNVLVKEDVYNPKNDAVRMSWDDLFESRMFASYIVQESNVFDRRIQDYKTGIDALEESERVKDDIFKFEHDLWSF